MEPEGEDRLDLRQECVIGFFEQLDDAIVDRFPETVGLGHGWPRDQPAQVAPVHVARGVVVRIEEVSVLRNLGAIPRLPDFDDKRLEEPARMREMPLCRTHVRHRLDDAIFRLEIAAKARREIAHCPVTFEQLFRERTRIDLPSGNFVGAARRLGHKGLGRFQNGLTAFLFELFLARLDHLVVGGFLDSILDKMLAHIFIVLDSRGAVAGR